MLTLTPWSPFPGGHQRYWRHPDGIDTIAVRMYPSPGGFMAYLRQPNGHEEQAILWLGSIKQAKSNADIELDRVRREWAVGEADNAD